MHPWEWIVSDHRNGLSGEAEEQERASKPPTEAEQIAVLKDEISRLQVLLVIKDGVAGARTAQEHPIDAASINVQRIC